MYQSTVRLGAVALRVLDLDTMTAFYQEKLGFLILKQEENRVFLGIAGGDVLLILEKSAAIERFGYGLYHVAMVLPSKEALASFLQHLLTEKVSLQGGADHGYSEALYLQDPEGNGLEFYYDKPEEVWDKRSDGRIIGVTEELDAASLLALARDEKPYRLPLDTRVGHLHFSVSDAKKTSMRYQKIFGMTEKFGVPGASWIASGNYHHHLAFNEWEKRDRKAVLSERNALAFVTLIYEDALLYQAVKKKAQLYGMHLVADGEKSYHLQDPAGINLTIVLEEKND